MCCLPLLSFRLNYLIDYGPLDVGNTKLNFPDALILRKIKINHEETFKRDAA